MSRRQARHFRGDLVKTARHHAGLTNEDLAWEVSVTLRTVQRWQDGESEPRGAQLLNLAYVLDVAPDDFYTETEVAA